MRSNQVLGTLIAVLAVLGGACSSGSDSSTGTGGGAGSSAAGTSRATTASGGAVGGESKTSAAGSSATGGASTSQPAAGASAGSSASPAGSGGKGGTSATGAGGLSKTGGATGGGAGGTGGVDAGVADGGGAGSGGRTGTGGVGVGGTSAGGNIAGSTGSPDAGTKDGLAPEGGTGGRTGTFDPCPASGACKILPLGDSITWGVNYDGGYRVKLFSNAIADKKNITYVGKLSNGPATAGGTTFPKNNEGHSGWTIQQIDDVVTGKSSEANYSGKKMMTDLAPNIVLLHAGTNDTSRTPTGMPDRLGTLIDHILGDGPDVLLVVTTIIPIKQGSYGTIGETFNNAIPDLIKKRADAGKHIVLVDMFKSFPSAGLSSDGVHPNQQGYDWMAGVWYDAIKSYLH